LAAGDVCSIKSGAGRFKLAKVLAVDPGVIHVRVFKETFADRPRRASTTGLTLGTIHDPDGFGMGHLPLSTAGFGAWLPIRNGNEPVHEDELEGYRMWQDAGGGVWA
jgi:hypothetical protein